MNEDYTLAPFQADFVEKTTEGFRPGAVHVLLAPAGSGKSFALREVVYRLTANGYAKNILLLSQPPLVHEWASTLGDHRSDFPVTTLDAPAYRLLLERVGSEGPLPNGIYAMSVDLAKRSGIREHLRYTDWDLLVVDDAHTLVGERDRVVSDLRAASQPALVLATATLTPIAERYADEGEVTDWYGAVREWVNSIHDGPARVTKEALTYARSDAETRLLRNVVRIGRDLDETPRRILFQRAASSLNALELTISRLHRSEDTPARARQAMSTLLDEIQNIGMDPKLQSVFVAVLRRQVYGSHTVIFSEYLDTATYLAAAVGEEHDSCYLVHGRMAMDKRQGVLESFRSDGGILVSTSAATATVSLSFVQTVVHYDLPATLTGYARREGRYFRLGRVDPCVAYLLRPAPELLPVDKMVGEVLSTEVMTGAAPLSERDGASATDE